MTSQLNLFDRPTLNVLRTIKERMAEAQRSTSMSRAELCDRMNDMADRYGIRLMKGSSKRLSTATLEKWLNPADREHYPSPNALEVFCAATGSIEVMRAMVEPLGWQVIGEDDARLLAWARHYFAAREARARMKRIEAEL